VFASHNLGQVKRLATRVVYLEQGTCWPTCRWPNFFERPAGTHCSRELAELFVKGELG
jgi:tungstate transport system ATP-binding protein